jgi:polyisoprenoid-binding protein YceI
MLRCLNVKLQGHFEATGESMPETAVEIPGYIAGAWDIDPNHSEVSFTVGHLVVSKVHGRFDTYSGTIVTDKILERSSVTATIDASSVDTHLPVRDTQIRSADFLDVEHFPNLTFVSSAIRTEGGRFFIDGDLTIRGTTRPVTLDVTVNGFSPDTFGNTRASFSAVTRIDRTDFGVSFNAPIPGLDKAMLLSNEVTLTLDLEAILQRTPSVS